MSKERFWVRYTSMWTNTEKIASFDTEEEAIYWKNTQKYAEILPWGGGEKLIEKLKKEAANG